MRGSGVISSHFFWRKAQTHELSDTLFSCPAGHEREFLTKRFYEKVIFLYDSRRCCDDGLQKGGSSGIR